MAKQVIILDTNVSDGGLVAVRAAFWIPVTPGQETPLPALASSNWRGADGKEITALQEGSVVEEVRQFVFGRSLDTPTVQKLIQVAYDDRLAYLESIPPRGQFYGAYLDNGSWTAAK